MAMYTQADARWPTLTLGREAFQAAVERRLGQRPDIADALQKMRGEDVYLAAACELGDDRAVTAFRDQWMSAVRTAVARVAPGAMVDDLCQQVFEKLFVGPTPAIAKYQGWGKLSTWVMTVATRLAQTALRKKQPVPSSDDDKLEERVVTDDDPELSALKSRYRREFKEAFAYAFGMLTPRQRNLLRHELVDRLTLDGIAALYDVHRATVARWRADCRATLLGETRRYFADELNVDEAELHSIVMLINSQLDVSMSRLLADEPPSVPDRG